MRALTELQKRVEALRQEADAALEALAEEAERRGYGVWTNRAGDITVLPEEPRAFRRAIRRLSGQELCRLLASIGWEAKWADAETMEWVYGPRWREHLALLRLEAERRREREGRCESEAAMV
jgi:hypothetical protein